MKKLIAVLLVTWIVSGVSTVALGWEGHYRYKEGRYYRDAGWWGLGGFVTGLAVGASVASLPPRYEVVYVGGIPYYYADGYYYQVSPGGYVVVSPPVVQGQIPPTGNNTLVYILGTLFGIFLLLCIGILIRKLLTKELRST